VRLAKKKRPGGRWIISQKPASPAPILLSIHHGMDCLHFEPEPLTRCDVLTSHLRDELRRDRGRGLIEQLAPEPGNHVPARIEPVGLLAQTGIATNDAGRRRDTSEEAEMPQPDPFYRDDTEDNRCPG
jgi:hypothetical protein